jgi:hypothetical protein
MTFVDGAPIAGKLAIGHPARKAGLTRRAFVASGLRDFLQALAGTLRHLHAAEPIRVIEHL